MKRGKQTNEYNNLNKLAITALILSVLSLICAVASEENHRSKSIDLLNQSFETIVVEDTDNTDYEYMYYKNSKEILEWLNEYIDDKSDIIPTDENYTKFREIETYRDTYLNEMDGYSEYRYSIEIDMFVDMYKDILLDNTKFKKLITKREAIYQKLEEMGDIY